MNGKKIIIKRNEQVESHNSAIHAMDKIYYTLEKELGKRETVEWRVNGKKSTGKANTSRASVEQMM